MQNIIAKNSTFLIKKKQFKFFKNASIFIFEISLLLFFTNLILIIFIFKL